MDRRTFLKVVAGTGAATMAVCSGTAIAVAEKATPVKSVRKIGVWNEWGRLREAVVGIPDDTVEMDYISAMKWLPDWEVNELKKLAGKKTAQEEPEIFARLKAQIEGHVKALQDHGVVVHRTKPLAHQEEQNFLTDIQRGNMLFGGADFFRVIGDNVILLNSFRYPFRRKQVWAVRPVVEELIKGTNARYVASPPPSPHYTDDDLYLENGDIMLDGFNVYVGMSGNASSPRGVDWLRQFLGPRYKIYVIRLAPERFHLDWVLSLNRPGLLTYCPAAFIDELPKPLRKWDKIVVNPDENAGANNLSIDPNTIVVAQQYDRIAAEYRKRGMKVITIPLQTTIEYGSSARCLTAVLSRDH
jgi:N-dimethylarginine dimethylaminohydrolase